MLKETIIKKGSFNFKRKNLLVRLNIQLVYMNIKDDFIKKGYKLDKDFKMRLE